jgi:hypothetical protein
MVSPAAALLSTPCVASAPRHRRFQFDPAEGVSQPSTHPTAHDNANDKNQDGSQHFGTEPDGEVQNRAFDLVDRSELFVHRHLGLMA